VARARRYAVEADAEVDRFIDLMLTVGVDFDSRPEMEWAANILEDRGLDDRAKMDLVYTSPRHFKGKISFSYAASDGSSESEIATVQIKFGRHHRSHHKVAKGNELDDFGPRHPVSHMDHFERGHDTHAAIFYDQAPATLGFDETVFNSPLRDESHWLFG